MAYIKLDANNAVVEANAVALQLLEATDSTAVIGKDFIADMVAFEGQMSVSDEVAKAFAGDTQVGTIRAYASDTLGIDMCSLKDHTILGFSPWERPGGAEHQLLLLDEGVYYTELKITMPKMVTTEKARVSRGHC